MRKQSVALRLEERRFLEMSHLRMDFRELPFGEQLLCHHALNCIEGIFDVRVPYELILGQGVEIGMDFIKDA